ncbi:hypothetical protein [Dyadobacter fanqingshengii]|uniref:Uncharacterized protein n=1 Tax=Dyadobacter fanqingshengii TaxID=2906443 RepID=A0A9X1P9H1_9BACT|nr:hypothetical protein [Dyadobacter fanqingshengii]MCF0039793.1 hypothetical protein [Dyadobacter fanqingshengii]USJ38444.1 hypothetical protein NFI81_11815 [Dyadobacter fanqingshengii]
MLKQQTKTNEDEVIPFFAVVDDRHIEVIEKVAETMEDMGFVIDRIRRFTGTISGSVSNIDLIHRAHIDGVNIRAEQKYQLH